MHPNCYICPYPDCVYEGKSEYEDGLIEAIPKKVGRPPKERTYGTAYYLQKSYEQSEKGRAKKKRYYASDKGKAALKRYDQSEKGKERWKRYYQAHREEILAKQKLKREAAT